MTGICLQSFTAGVPQGGIWSPILFNLYICYLPDQILHCTSLQYAEDSTLIKVLPSKDNRITAADKMNADLASIYLWGRMWNINFEPAKCHSLCVSLLRDIDTELHPHAKSLCASNKLQLVDENLGNKLRTTYISMIMHITLK